MSIPHKDRNKASRIRAKGRAASPAQRAWLERYDDKRRRPRAPTTAPTAPEPAPAPAPAPPPPEPDSAPQAEAETVEAGELVFVDFKHERPPDESQSQAPPDKPHTGAKRCPVPNCSECAKAGQSRLICGVTGKPAWPGIGMESARFIASVLMGIIGFVTKYFRSDRTIVEPTAEEREACAAAIHELVNRRAQWIGAVDDFLRVFWTFGAYTKRTLAEPAAPAQAAAA